MDDYTKKLLTEMFDVWTYKSGKETFVISHPDFESCLISAKKLTEEGLSVGIYNNLTGVWINWPGLSGYFYYQFVLEQLLIENFKYHDRIRETINKYLSTSEDFWNMDLVFKDNEFETSSLKTLVRAEHGFQISLAEAKEAFKNGHSIWPLINDDDLDD